MVSKIEQAVEHLTKVENKLDELYEIAKFYRKELIDLASKEAEKLKARILEQAKANEDRLYSEEVSMAEEAAKEILAKGVWEANAVRKKADEMRAEAEKLVLDAILRGK
ncbi:MAG: hypothetical protein QW470_07185 [Candidatus Caldarchaeum sp.]|uniref:Uncharacterized protein n=1 Tax=Caldiarchaeum subterraneum TaxID=311458 RepID=A0A7C5LDU1_CALS0